MKAFINEHGKIELIAETPVEKFALKQINNSLVEKPDNFKKTFLMHF
jgi:hypothetical protein